MAGLLTDERCKWIHGFLALHKLAKQIVVHIWVIFASVIRTISLNDILDIEDTNGLRNTLGLKLDKEQDWLSFAEKKPGQVDHLLFRALSFFLEAALGH